MTDVAGRFTRGWDLSDRIDERTASIREMQVAILEMIARGAPIDAVLADICTWVERLISGSVVGVTVLDRAARSFERAIFPSLGPTFENVIPGLRVADRPGSCAVAVYHGEVVTSDDIAADERFRNEWRLLNREHGVQSIQSRPVFACDGTSLGTFVIGFRERRPAAAFDEEAAAVGAHLTGLALTRHRAEQEQQLLIGELEHRTRNLFSSIGSLVYFTLQANPDPSQFKKVFEGRLAALSRAHSLVLQREGADLAGLITDIPVSYTHLTLPTKRIV